MKNNKADLLLKLLSMAPEGPIVEIGCIRNAIEVVEDGFSTYYIAKFAEQHGKTFVSCDVEPTAVNIANNILSEHGLHPIVKLIDGKIILSTINEPIAFLFLDSHKNPFFSFEQFKAANLRDGAIVAVDDAQQIENWEFGKATFIKMMLDKFGHEYSIVDTCPGWRTLFFTMNGAKKSGELICKK